MKIYKFKKIIALLLSINIIGTSALIPINNVYGERESQTTTDDSIQDEDFLQEKFENETNQKNFKLSKEGSDLNAPQILSWDELQDTINNGKTVLDISKLEDDASGKVIEINGKNVEIISNSEKIFKNLQFRIKNSGVLTINNLNINNKNFSKTLSPIYIEGNTENIVKLKNINRLIPNQDGSGIAVNNKKLHKEEVDTNFSLLGDGSLYIESGITNKQSGAGIGGEFGNASGNMFFGEDISIEIKSLGLGAGIGGGTNQLDYSNGNITISDNADIKISGEYMDPDNLKTTSAGIGSGTSVKSNESYIGYSGKITIEKNSKIFIQKYGNNFSGIGTTDKMGNLDDIIIKDNTNIIIGINMEYSPEKYGDKNFGFEDVKDRRGTHISAIGSGGNSSEDVPTKILIEDKPNIKIGSKGNGINLRKGKINIGRDSTEDKINLKIIGLTGGIKTGIFAVNESHINISNTIADIRAVNYYEENGKIKPIGFGSGIETTTKIDINNSNLDIKAYNGAAIGGSSNVFSNSTGEDYPTYTGGLNINIKNSTIKGKTEDGAAIGGFRRVASYGEINLENNKLIDISSEKGSAIGTGLLATDSRVDEKLIINLKDNEKIIANSIYGSAIGNGQGTENEIDINLINNDIEANSLYGAGIGAGSIYYVLKEDKTMSDYRISSSANINIKGGKTIAKSLSGSGIGGGGIDYTDQNIKRYLPFFYSDRYRTIETEGKLSIGENADILAMSNGKLDDIYLKPAISGKLLENSNSIISSNTLDSTIALGNEDINITVYDENGKKVRDFNIKNDENSYNSYGYTTNNNSKIYSEKIDYKIDDENISGNIIQKLPPREKGRHPENLTNFYSVNQYMGSSQDIIDDNTFVDIEKVENYIIKFDGNGGYFNSEENTINEITTNKGKINLEDIKNPEKLGYIFLGWLEDINDEKNIIKSEDISNIIFEENKTYYAKWEKKEIPVERLSDTVVLASGYKYTDVLTATVLANEKKAPILLSEVDTLTDDTMTEIKRINPKEIIISGGENSVSKKVENLLKSEFKDISIIRVSGKDRYETAKNIGVKVREISPNKTEAMLVDGTNFPDVITMSTIASERRAPILLTEPSVLNETTKNTLNEFNIKDIIIGGGFDSVSENIEKNLKTNISTIRYGGSDRYETASIVGNAYRTMAGVSNNLIIVDGTNFPDGITTSSLASKIKAPILLTKPNSLPEVTAKDINTWKATNTIIAGGENSVSANIFNKVNGSERISGKDRYETAVKISQKYLEDK